jgi:putative FmdB family regulatory protein
MPIHEYKCDDCKEEYEELVALSEKSNPPCPACKSENTQRKISSCSSSAGVSSCGSGGFT